MPKANECWITTGTYLALMDEFVKPRSRRLLVGDNGEKQKTLLLRGDIYGDSLVLLDPLFVLQGPPNDLEPGDYTYELQNSNQEILSSGSFQPSFVEDPESGEKIFGVFYCVIPYPDGTKRLTLKHGDTIIKEVIVSTHNPTVTINSITKLGDNTFSMNWNAFDEDGDSLTYSILYSPNGSEWNMLEFETTNPSFNYTFNVSSLPGGENCFIKIIATDGINTTEKVSSPFQVTKNTLPSVMISPPKQGAKDGEFSFESGTNYKLMGYAYDLEDGDLNGSSLTWHADIAGDLGNGDTLSLDLLPPGTYTITLTARDSQGAEATSEPLTITLIPATPPVAVCKNSTVQLDAEGTATITPAPHQLEASLKKCQ